MASESTTFGLSTALLLAGLAVMLYGVTLNNGQSMNAVMAAGGAVMVLAIGILTTGVIALDEGHTAE